MEHVIDIDAVFLYACIACLTLRSLIILQWLPDSPAIEYIFSLGKTSWYFNLIQICYKHSYKCQNLPPTWKIFVQNNCQFIEIEIVYFTIIICDFFVQEHLLGTLRLVKKAKMIPWWYIYIYKISNNKTVWVLGYQVENIVLSHTFGMFYLFL